MTWYDVFSGFYNTFVEPHYKKARKFGSESLNLKEGDVVLDLACGTGPNFKHLSPAVGSSGTVIGLDYSKGMISRAEKEIVKNDWKNIQLIQEDAKALNRELIDEICGRKIRINSVIVVLGLSVIPNYEEVFRNTFDLLEPNGTYTIIDVYADKFVPQKWMVEMIARADVKRKSWALLEERCSNFSLTYLSKNRHLHGGLLYLASGTKNT